MDVNEPASSRRANVSGAFQHWAAPAVSPIDRYYDELRALRAFYARFEGACNLDGSPLLSEDLSRLGEMVFLRSVTAFEDYLKQLIARSVSDLPSCQKQSLKHQVPLSAVFSYHDMAALGLTEGKSVGEWSEVAKRLNTYLGIQVNTTAFGTLGEDLDMVLQLRHCLVHSLGILSAHDSIKLSAIDKVGWRFDVSHDKDTLVDLLGVIDRACRAINQTACDQIESELWLKRYLTGDEVQDRGLFGKLVACFWSTRDKDTPDMPTLYHQSRSVWLPRVAADA